MGVPLSALSNLLNERRRVSRGLAVELARITGTNAVFWLVLQAHYDAWVLENGAVTKKPRRKGRIAISRLLPPFGAFEMTAMS
jgi:plasmid maintenance system antidote protein VapI